MSSGKRKRVVLTLEDKIDIIARLEQGERAIELAHEYNVGFSTVHDIKNRKKELTKFVDSVSTDKVLMRCTIKTPKLKDPQLDKALYAWVMKREELGHEINLVKLKEKAEKLHCELKGPHANPHFRVTDSWLRKFTEAHDICLAKGRSRVTKKAPTALRSPSARKKRAKKPMSYASSDYDGISTSDSPQDERMDHDVTHSESVIKYIDGIKDDEDTNGYGEIMATSIPPEIDHVEYVKTENDVDDYVPLSGAVVEVEVKTSEEDEPLELVSDAAALEALQTAILYFQAEPVNGPRRVKQLEEMMNEVRSKKEEKLKILSYFRK